MMIAGVHLKTEEETEEESMKMLVKSRVGFQTHWICERLYKGCLT